MSSMRMRHQKLLALAALQLTCHQVIMTAPPGSTIAVFANPQFIAANGDVSIVKALVTEPAGTPVPDGTVVQFFTNLGRVDEQGKTNDGVATVNFVSDSRSGTATVSAFSGGPATAPAASASAAPGGGSGGTSGSVQIVIGATLPAVVQMTASPQTVIEPPRTSTIRAFVFDANGNPVFNVPVLFVLSDSVPTPAPSASPSPGAPTGGLDFLESRGTPQPTDHNGIAVDVLIVRTLPTAASRVVTITATTPNGKTANVPVRIN